MKKLLQNLLEESIDCKIVHAWLFFVHDPTLSETKMNYNQYSRDSSHSLFLCSSPQQHQEANIMGKNDILANHLWIERLYYSSRTSTTISLLQKFLLLCPTAPEIGSFSNALQPSPMHWNHPLFTFRLAFHHICNQLLHQGHFGMSNEHFNTNPTWNIRAQHDECAKASLSWAFEKMINKKK